MSSVVNAGGKVCGERGFLTPRVHGPSRFPLFGVAQKEMCPVSNIDGACRVMEELAGSEG